ncbi:MAG TPA: aminotransferase class V-fold PLP-dependent enzyme [Acidobacteriota bacterium]|nr:aminotransferase class V-fold PLP-dependent enzyme [Acidobacteriota bacterium]
MNRRSFLGAVGIPSLVLPAPLPSLETLAAFWEAAGREQRSPAEVARDEAFWAPIQQAFTPDRSIVNLNSGGVSPSPSVVQDSMKRHLDYSNTAPAYTMWRVLEPQKETVRQRLARRFGCSPGEIAITRNASESLQICQFGFDLKPGDEVLTTNQDYPRMITTFQQRVRREGIALKQISIPIPAENDDQIVALFEERVTSRTRLILICHMINLTGQILPVRKVVQMARKRNVPVIVDGAHAFAHFHFERSDLDCDYYASSLHKWLFAPHGTGLLFVRESMIRNLWPLMAASESQQDDVRKFEEIGTHPLANFLAIAEALTFHEGIGPERKEARMRRLKDYWAKRLLENPRVRLHTSLDPRYSCGLATFQVEGIDSVELTSHLWRVRRILVTPIVHPEFQGIRVTPNLFTTLSELDYFCDAVEDVVRNGLPG